MRNIFTEQIGLASEACPDVGGLVCFSGDNLVQLRDEQVIAMKDLRVDDYVKDGAGSYSRVYSFGHYSETMRARYLQLFTKELIDSTFGNIGRSYGFH